MLPTRYVQWVKVDVNAYQCTLSSLLSLANVPRCLIHCHAPTCIDHDHIESVINKAQRYGYLSSSFENVHSLVYNMESKLFNSILSNPRHVLYQLLPPEKDTGYSLRPRSHHLTLPFTDNNMIRKNFLHRKLFMDTY